MTITMLNALLSSQDQRSSETGKSFGIAGTQTRRGSVRGGEALQCAALCVKAKGLWAALECVQSQQKRSWELIGRRSHF